jgi:hypothetical protein
MNKYQFSSMYEESWDIILHRLYKTADERTAVLRTEYSSSITIANVFA